MIEESGRVPDGTGLSSTTAPQEGRRPSGFDPSRAWAKWLERASVLANDSWTPERWVRISCTPNGFWIEGRLLIRSEKREVRAEQLRPYSYVALANADTLTPAVERVLEMLAARDSDGSPKGGDAEGGSVRSTTARPEGIAQ